MSVALPRRAGLALVACAALLVGCGGGARYRVATNHPRVDAASLRAIEAKVEAAAAAGVYPGGVVSVAAQWPQLERAVGRVQAIDGRRTRVDRATMFDVASLTKPMITATAAACLVADGRLAWDERVVGTATVDDLLAHRAPMPENFDWWTLEAARREGDDPSPAEACTRVLAATPGDQLRIGYSNAGYYLLGAVLEQRASNSLEAYLDQRLFAGTALQGMTFRPEPGRTVARVAPDVVAGTPFDPLAAWALATWPDSTPGHSGLFATAGATSQWTLAAMEPDSPWGAALFERSDPAAARSRAFEVVPRRDGSGVAYRHTGYTGCVMWLDPERRLSLVLLTNRGGAHDDAWDRHVADLVNELERGWHPRGG